MKKSVENNGIKISLELLADGSVNMKKMMHIQFADDSGEVIEFDAYPDVTAGKNIGTIKTQFQYVETLIKFDTAYANAVLKNIKAFLKERPQLSVSGISIEAGFSSRYLSFILDGDKPITKNLVEKLLPIMIKYGYGRK